MIPEAFAQAHDFAGLVTAGGSLAAFVLMKAEARGRLTGPGRSG